MILTMAWQGWVVGILTVLFLLICVMMVLTVLIQRPQGGGLSGAFGSGAGSGQTAFGAKTGDALTIFTIIVFVLFLGLAITLNYGYRPSAAPPAGDVIQAGDQPPATPGTGAPKGAEIPAAPPATPADPGVQTPPPPAPAVPPAGDPAPSQPPAPSDQPK